MSGVESSLYSTAFAVSAFAAALLRRREGTLAGVGTGFPVFLGVVAFGFICEVLMTHPAAPLKSLWLGLRLSSSLLLAPLLWLSIRERVGGRPLALAALGGRAWTAIGTGVLLTGPLISRAHFGTTYVNPTAPASALTSGVIHAGMLGCVAIFAIQCPLYLQRCRTLLRDRNAPAPTSDEPLARSSWLHLPLLLVATLWALGLLRALQCMLLPAHLESALPFAVADVTVTIAAVYLMACRAAPAELAWGTADEPAEAPSPESVPTSDAAAPATSGESVHVAERRYAKSPLDATVRERIKQKLVRALGPDALYCDSLISLRSLGAALKENPRHVSQVISQDLSTSFYALISQHRIEEAKRRLRASPTASVLEIALAVGFNSKSTFHTAFRRQTGMTPTEYRASNALPSITPIGQGESWSRTV